MHTIEYTKLLPGIPRLYLSLGQTGLENKYLDDPPPLFARVFSQDEGVRARNRKAKLVVHRVWTRDCINPSR